MATVRIAVGTAHYGTIYHRRGGSSSTRFWFIAYFPLIPLGGERNLPDAQGFVRSESRLYLPSLLLALFNAWGLVALALLIQRAYFDSAHTMEKTAAALVMMGALFGSWIWGGGMWRFPEMRRHTLIKAGVLGAIGLVLGVVMVRETQESLRFQALHAQDGMTPTQKLEAMASSLKGLADEEKAARQGGYEASCSKGDQTACVQAARALEATDPAKAQGIYRRACDQSVGLGCSRLGLGLRYQSKPDLAQAWQLMKRACDLGDGFGCYHLGDMARLGSGTPRDPAAASAYFKHSCELGYAAACKMH